MAYDYIGIAYSTALILGGISGYLSKGSVMSLVAGSSLGLVALFGAYLYGRDPTNPWVQGGATLFCLIMMGMRYHKTQRFIPAGAIAILSLLNLGRLAFNHFR